MVRRNLSFELDPCDELWALSVRALGAWTIWRNELVSKDCCKDSRSKVLWITSYRSMGGLGSENELDLGCINLLSERFIRENFVIELLLLRF